eukprot:SAG31_NODE_22854_length_516_cov_1.458034_1_plen_106_part_00
MQSLGCGLAASSIPGRRVESINAALALAGSSLERTLWYPLRLYAGYVLNNRSFFSRYDARACVARSMIVARRLYISCSDERYPDKKWVLSIVPATVYYQLLNKYV